MGETRSSAATGRVDRFTEDSELWSRWWENHGHHFLLRHKYRFGELFQPQATLEELQRSPVARDHRELAELELGLMLPSFRASDTGDWVDRQRASLEQCRRHLEQHAVALGRPLHKPGEWLTDRLGQQLPAQEQAETG